MKKTNTSASKSTVTASGSVKPANKKTTVKSAPDVIPEQTAPASHKSSPVITDTDADKAVKHFGAVNKAIEQAKKDAAMDMPEPKKPPIRRFKCVKFKALTHALMWCDGVHKGWKLLDCQRGLVYRPKWAKELADNMVLGRACLPAIAVTEVAEYRDPDSKDKYIAWRLMDGQQRLTALYIQALEAKKAGDETRHKRIMELPVWVDIIPCPTERMAFALFGDYNKSNTMSAGDAAAAAMSGEQVHAIAEYKAAAEAMKLPNTRSFNAADIAREMACIVQAMNARRVNPDRWTVCSSAGTAAKLVEKMKPVPALNTCPALLTACKGMALLSDKQRPSRLSDLIAFLFAAALTGESYTCSRAEGAGIPVHGLTFTPEQFKDFLVGWSGKQSESYLCDTVQKTGKDSTVRTEAISVEKAWAERGSDKGSISRKAQTAEALFRKFLNPAAAPEAVKADTAPEPEPEQVEEAPAPAVILTPEELTPDGDELMTGEDVLELLNTELAADEL